MMTEDQIARRMAVLYAYGARSEGWRAGFDRARAEGWADQFLSLVAEVGDEVTTGTGTLAGARERLASLGVDPSLIDNVGELPAALVVLYDEGTVIANVHGLREVQVPH